jgi:hypothetical protein
MHAGTGVSPPPVPRMALALVDPIALKQAVTRGRMRRSGKGDALRQRRNVRCAGRMPP